MIMKKRTGTVIMGICILLASSQVFSAEELRDRNKVFVDKLFQTIEELMKKNHSRNEGITERYLSIVDKLEKNELKISIDNSYPRSIYGGIAFIFNEDDNIKPCIVMSDYFIELFEKRPSLVMCLMFHEFDHAYNYFKNKESFKKAHKDIIEKYLYEMDATYVQAMFLRDIVPGNNYSLTNYEKYLIVSLKDDNLDSASLVFQVTDMRLIYQLVRIMKGEDTREEKIHKIQKISSDILSSFSISDKDSEWDKFQSLVTLLSFENYIANVLYQIEDIDYKAKNKTGRFSMSNFPEINKNKKKMADLVKPHLKFISQYEDKIRKMFAEF